MSRGAFILGSVLMLIALPARADNQAAVDALLSDHTDSASFQKDLDAATAAGVSSYLLTEGKLRFYLKSGDYADLYKMNGDLDGLVTNWQAGQSKFKSKEEAQLLVDVARVESGSAAHDVKVFQPAAEELFWLDPSTGQKLSELITNFKNQDKLKDLVVPLDTVLVTSDGNKVSLKNLLGSHKALYLDFWGSWCGPCMERMPALEARGKALIKEDIVVAGVNIEHFDKGGDADAAEKVRKDDNMTIPWLVEPPSIPLQSLLSIDSIPRTWIIDASGKVLFAGHPDDQALVDVLQKNYQASF
jgi:thiol-disulfide isomerase/thioredoxin